MSVSGYFTSVSSQQDDTDVEKVEEDPLEHHRSLLSPLLPQQEPLLDLEQQWQDVLALMDPQVITAVFLLCRIYLFSSCFEFPRGLSCF